MHATRRSFLTGALAAAAGAGASSPSVLAQGPEKSPASGMTVDARPTIASPDDDPYLWLEEVDGERALAWVEARNGATLARYGNARFAADRDVLTTMFDRPDRIPGVARAGGLLYNFWIDAANPRGVWRRTTLASYRTEQPIWETILDIDALAAKEGEDWVMKGGAMLPGTLDRAILSLSRGGSDAVVLREFDMATKAFVADGFVLPEAKGGATWLDRDTLLLSSAFGTGMATASGYARTVRLWRRGTAVEIAPVLFETVPERISVGRRPRPHPGSGDGLVRRAADIPRFGDLDGRPYRPEGEARSAERCRHGSLSGVDGGEPSHRVERRRRQLCAGYAARDAAGALPRRRARLLRSVRAGRATYAGGISSGAMDGSRFRSSTICSRVYEVLTPSAGGWARSTLPGLPTIGIVGRGAARRRPDREQRRPARLGGGPDHAPDHDAYRARQATRPSSSARRATSRPTAWW